MSQLHALSRLERHGPATGTALAHAEGMRPQSMGAIIAVLEREALVVRAQDPNDGRQSIFSVTPKAKDLIASYRIAREDWLYKVIKSRLAAGERAGLRQTLALLNRVLGE